MPKDNKVLKGRVNVFLRDARTGQILDERRVDNLVVNTGEDWVAQRLVSGATTQNMDWIELGLGTAAAAGTDTALQTTLAGSRKSGTNSVSGATWQLVVNWGTSEANTSGIEEAGIFGTTSSGGQMLARTVFAAVNKTNSDTLQIQWQINVSDDGV
tara:strand:- start:4478 stop:4945 length:468 start_codon:yes stop_codon:yes gene_type:complete